MKKALLAIAVIYGVAALIAPYFAGRFAEEELHKFFDTRIDQAALEAQGIDLSLKQYHKGYFSSTADIHFSITDIASDEVYYEADIVADIKHAPLSLSGFNAVTTDVTTTSKPIGLVGKYLPQDFAAIKIEKRLLDFISAKEVFHTDLTFNPLTVKPQDEDVELQFNGLKANYLSSFTDAKVSSGTFEFKGLNFKPVDRDGALTIEPSTATVKYVEETASIDFVFDKIHLDFHDTPDNISLSFKLDNFIYSVGMIPTSDEKMPFIPSDIGLSFSDLVYDSINGAQAINGSVKNGAFRLGFSPNGDDYAFKFTTKAQPEISGAFAKLMPFAVTDVDINLSFGPFKQDILKDNLHVIINQINVNPEMSEYILSDGITGLFSASLLEQDMTLMIAAKISNDTETLFSAKGEVKEHITTEDEIMTFMFDKRTLPHFMSGSQLDFYVSDTLLSLSNQAMLLQMMPETRDGFDENGNFTLELRIDEDQVLLNGKPAQL